MWIFGADVAQAGVALILDQHDRAGIGDQKIGAGDSDIGFEELFTQNLAGQLGLILDDNFFFAAEFLAKKFGHIVAGLVKRGSHNMIGPLFGKL